MKLTKFMSYALILSLSLNALVLGFVGLRLFLGVDASLMQTLSEGNHNRVRGTSSGSNDFQLFQQALPLDIREKLKQSVKKRRADLDEYFEVIYQSRAAISMMLDDELVNNVALNAAFGDLRDANVGVQTILQEETIIALESLDQEQRVEVVEALKREEARRQRRSGN